MKRDDHFMNPERVRAVKQQFSCRESAGPFTETFMVGEQLVFLHYRENDNESAVFARLSDVQRCTVEQLTPSPQYETGRAQFEADTEATQI
jgi:hypothetical protein